MSFYRRLEHNEILRRRQTSAANEKLGVSKVVRGEGAQIMINFYDDLFFSTGADGASAPVGVARKHDEVEVDILMDAWFKERRDSIECSMFLDRAKQLLNEILGDEDLTPRSKRKVRNFIRAIRDCRG